MVCSKRAAPIWFQDKPASWTDFPDNMRYSILPKLFEVHSLESTLRYSGVLSGFRIRRSYKLHHRLPTGLLTPRPPRFKRGLDHRSANILMAQELGSGFART